MSSGVSEIIVDATKSSDPVCQVKEDKTEEKDTKPKPLVTFNCELCNVQCSSEEVFQTHLKGQKHTKKQKRKQEMEQSGLSEKITNSETYCKLCSVELTSRAHMPLHFAGKRHRQNLLKDLSSRSDSDKVTQQVEQFEKKQKEDEEKLIARAGIKDWSKYDIPADRKQQALAEGAKNEFFCSLCTKYFSGRTQLAMHLMSSRHKEKEHPQLRLKRAANRGGGNSRKGFGRRNGERNQFNRRFERPTSLYSSNSFNFSQNLSNDLSADFSIPAYKVSRMDFENNRQLQEQLPFNDYRNRRFNNFAITPDHKPPRTTLVEDYHHVDSHLKPVYSTYQSRVDYKHRDNSNNRQDSWQGNDAFEAETAKNLSYWNDYNVPSDPAPPEFFNDGRNDMYEPHQFNRYNQFNMGNNRTWPPANSNAPPPPPQYQQDQQGGMQQNYYDDYNPLQFRGEYPDPQGRGPHMG